MGYGLGFRVRGGCRNQSYSHRLLSSSFFGLPYGILKYHPQKGTTKEPMGNHIDIRKQDPVP